MLDFKAHYDKSVAIYGAGPAGLAAFRTLYRAGAHIHIWDPDQERRAKLVEAGVKPVKPADWPWDELSFVMPDFDSAGGLTLAHSVMRMASHKKVPVRSDIDILMAAIAALPVEERPQVVGVTGSHGKTVSCSLIVHALKQAGRRVFQVGHVAEPALSLEKVHPAETLVLDMSARKLAFTRQLRCHAGVLLNMTTADIAFFRNAERFVRGASRIFRNQKDNDAMIIGADDPMSQKVCTALSSSLSHESFGSENIIPVSGDATLGQGVFLVGGRVYDARHGKTMEIGDTIQAGAIRMGYFDQNVAAVYAVCMHLGMSPATVTLALRTWPGISGRMFTMAEQGKVIVIDDSHSQSLRSTVTGLKKLKNVFWVGGGHDVPADLHKLREAENAITKAFFFGAAALELKRQTANAFEGMAYDTPRESINQAITEATVYTEEYGLEEAVVVLSPGCADATHLEALDLLPANTELRKKGAAA